MHTGNVNKIRIITAIAIVTALITTTSLTMTIAPDVYAYKKTPGNFTDKYMRKW